MKKAQALMLALMLAKPRKSRVRNHVPLRGYKESNPRWRFFV